jgi:hypothetical protein
MSRHVLANPWLLKIIYNRSESIKFDKEQRESEINKKKSWDDTWSEFKINLLMSFAMRLPKVSRPT